MIIIILSIGAFFISNMKETTNFNYKIINSRLYYYTDTIKTDSSKCIDFIAKKTNCIGAKNKEIVICNDYTIIKLK